MIKIDSFLALEATLAGRFANNVHKSDPILEHQLVNAKQSKPGSLERAIAIAVQCHSAATDKAGAPYILHPLRVMLSLDNPTEQIVAVLHDVVEDCFEGQHAKGWQFLKDEGFSREVIAALKCVTKNKKELDKPDDDESTQWENYRRFIARVILNPIARAVKLADLNDNLDVTRLSVVSSTDAARLSKYLKAREFLLFTDPDSLPRKGETLIEYVKRHHATLDDPLNEGISDAQAIRNGTLLSPDAPEYKTGTGAILAFGGQPSGQRKAKGR